MAKVFISYSRRDLPFVERMVQDLEGAGVSVWYDLSGLEGGEKWVDKIQRALRECECVIVVLSPDSIQSEWVEREFLFASNLKKRIVPLLYRECELPFNYLNLNYIDIQGGNYRQNFPNILEAIDNKPTMLKTAKNSAARPAQRTAHPPVKQSNTNKYVIGCVVFGIIGLAVLAGLAGVWLMPMMFPAVPTATQNISIPATAEPVNVPTTPAAQNIDITVPPMVEDITITPTITPTLTVTPTFTLPAPVKAWSAWARLGGVFTNAPSVTSWSADRLDVFVRGTNTHLMHRSWNGSAWSGWEDLGGELADSPACVSWGVNRIDCFVRGKGDSELWHTWWDGSRWGAWERPGGAFTGAPTVTSWSANRLDIFVRGNNTHLMHRSWSESGWSGWEDLGGELADSPSCVSRDVNRIDCFVSGKNDTELWHISWDGSKWNKWEKLGGSFGGAPTAASWSTDRLDVFVRGNNTHLMHRFWTGSTWSNWEDLGGELADAPACVSRDVDRINCFVRGKSDSELWHKLWNDSQ